MQHLDLETAWSNFCIDSNINGNGNSNNTKIVQIKVKRRKEEQEEHAQAEHAEQQQQTQIRPAKQRKPTNKLQKYNDENASPNTFIVKNKNKKFKITTDVLEEEDVPLCTSLYISTKTKISYLNSNIDLNTVFWNIPVIPYHEPNVGVVKKQMKFKCMTQAELDVLLEKKAQYEYVDESIFTQINNTALNAKIPFKDIRKISIGLCSKDITSYRCKKRKAFYNCFVMLLRVQHKGVFKEMHVKVFNTGKLEIPGVQDADLLTNVHSILVDILRPIVTDDLALLARESDTVLINSNFKCGYFVNRERFHHLLKYKYNINSNYDPCSYPGIQCEFYYDTLLLKQTGMQPSAANVVALAANNNDDVVVVNNVHKVSFMVFRTGSVLIVGKCTEFILYKVYDFLCEIFKREYSQIRGMTMPPGKIENVKKTRKVRKKTILMDLN